MLSIEKPGPPFYIVNAHLLASFLLFSPALCTHAALMISLCLCVSMRSLDFQNGEESLKGKLDRRRRVTQAKILKWVAISFSRASSRPRDRTHVSCIGRRILYQPGKPIWMQHVFKNLFIIYLFTYWLHRVLV